MASTYTPTFTPEQLYNTLMETIEPELTTENLPLLDDIYADESAEDRAVRTAWYEIAFSMFEEKYHRFVDGWKNYYTDLRKKAQHLERAATEQDERGDTDALERSLSQS